MEKGSGDVCEHEEVEFLGSQKTRGGYNRYYKCLGCRGVLVITPQEEAVYAISSPD